jgi:ATP-dependent Clp protease ATP-binding subunit ClpC
MTTDRFSERCREILDRARRHALRYRHDAISTSHLLLALLDEGASVGASTLRHLGLDMKALRAALERNLEPGRFAIALHALPYQKDARAALDAADRAAVERGSGFVGTEHLLLGLLADSTNPAAALLTRFGITRADAAAAAAELKADPARPATDATRSGRGARKPAGVLDTIGIDLGPRIQKRLLRPVCGRFPELEQMKFELAAPERRSILLLGPVGVGKTSAIHALAREILIGAVPSPLLCKRLIAIDRVRLVAGCRHKDDLESRIEGLLGEVERARDTILVFDDGAWLLDRGGATPATANRTPPPDGADALALLFRAVSDRRVQCIATLSAAPAEHDALRARFDAAFHVIALAAPDAARSLVTLLELREQFEQHHKVTITEDALRMAVQLALGAGDGDRLLRTALRLVDETAARMAATALTPPARAAILEREIQRLEGERVAAFTRKDFTDAARSFEEARVHREMLAQVRRRWKAELENDVRRIDEHTIGQTWATMGGYRAIAGENR